MSTTQHRTPRPCGYVQLQINGELVVWEPEGGRTSFALLQRRLSAGRRLLQFAMQHPAHLVVFDCLQAAGERALRDWLAARHIDIAQLVALAEDEDPFCE
jgi:ATP-dependent DNA ligase